MPSVVATCRGRSEKGVSSLPLDSIGGCDGSFRKGVDILDLFLNSSVYPSTVTRRIVHNLTLLLKIYTP